MRWIALIASLVVCAIAPQAFATKTCDDIIFSVDVPTTLGSTTLQAYQAIECKNNSYVSPTYFNGQGLTSRTNITSIAAISELKKGFIFTADASFTVSSTYCPSGTCTFTPRDIVKAECVTGTGCTTTSTTTLWNYSLYLSGDTLGLPANAVIDALAFDTDGSVLLSFDASETLPLYSGGSYTFQMNDIVKLVTESPATYSMFLQGGAIGLSSGVNVVGFDQTDTDYYFMFDTPTTISGQGYRAGSAYRRGKSTNAWSNTNPLYSDTAFPSGSIGTDFTLLPSPGEVPKVRSDETPNVQISKSGSDLTISWDAGCAQNVTGYAVYEGSIGSWTSHVPATYDGSTTVCSASSSPVTIQPATGSSYGTYYLVVPQSEKFEGSYGTDSSGSERSQSASPCQSKTKKAKSCS